MNIDKRYQRNINLLILNLFFQGFILGWVVIQVLFFQNLNLNFSQISIIFLVLSLTILICEIPTGILTDFHGRKKSIIIYGVFMVIVTFMYTLSSNFYSLLFVVAFHGLGVSFVSGTISSFLYESLKKLNRKSEYKKYISKAHLFFAIASIITGFTIPIIFKYNSHYPFYIGTFFAILLLITSFFLFEEVKVIKKNKSFEKSFIKKIKIQFVDSLNIVKKNNNIFWVILFSSFFGFSFGIFSDLIIQPLINNIYSLEFYGIIFGIVGIIKTFLLIYSHKIITFFEKRNLEFTFLILIWPLLLVLFINFISNIYLVTVIIGIMWSLGIYRIVIISDKLNSEIEDDSKRATILSSNSMVTSLVLILVFPIFGFLSDLISLEKVIYVLVGYSLVAGFILLYFKK